VVAPVVSGRIYKVRWFGDLASTVAADQLFVKIREDAVGGNILDWRRYRAHTTTNWPYDTEVEYTADATEDKTLVLTLVRESGTGTGRRDASATSKSYFTVDYIR
jgi:hypothetical protein